MSDREFTSKLKQARDRVVAMDQVDGYAERGLPTIAQALLTGVKRSNEDCVYDALFMLLDSTGVLDGVEVK
jgi:hypothetical protein